MSNDPLNISLSLNATSVPTSPTAAILSKTFLLIYNIKLDCFDMLIDNSSLERLQTCPRSAEMYCVKRREAPGTAALTYGSAIHNCLEQLYLRDYDVPTAELATIINDTFDAAGLAFNEHEWRSPERALATVEKYILKYQGDDYKVYHHEGTPFVERSFAIPLGDVEIDANVPYDPETLISNYDEWIKRHPIHEGRTPSTYINRIRLLWTGKMDVAVMAGNSSFGIMDHKTSSMGGDTFFKDFMLSQQTVGYTWAAKQVLGIRPAFFVLNAIIGRKPRKDGFQNLTLEREIYTYSDEQLDEWHKDVLCNLQYFVQLLCQGYFPKVTKWCFGKYGQCKFHDVCSAPHAMREAILASSPFTDVTWSPAN